MSGLFYLHSGTGRLLTDFGNVRLSAAAYALIQAVEEDADYSEEYSRRASRLMARVGDWLAPIYNGGRGVDRVTLRRSQISKWLKP